MDLDEAAALARARCWGRCEGCGQFGHIMDVHHRQARQAGGVHGAAAKVANAVTNLLVLCRFCHDSTEEDFRGTEAIGWRMPKWVDDPAEVPALIHTAQGYGWWILTHDAGFRWVDWPADHRITWDGPSR